MTDLTLAWLKSMYPLARPLGTVGEYVIVHPLTLGRWRVSRCTASAVLDGW